MKKTIIALIVILIISALTVGIILFVSSNKNNSSKTNENNKKYVYNNNINTISIIYYEGYNIATGDVIGDTIPVNKFDLYGNNLDKVSNLINNLTKITSEKDSEEYEHIIYDNICDFYRLNINNSLTLCIGEKYGFIEETEDYFKVPKDLFDLVECLASENSTKNLYKKIDTKSITISNGTNEIKIIDPNTLEELSNFNYYIINGDDDDFDYEELAYILNLDNGRKMHIYKYSVLGCIYYADNTYDYIYVGSLENKISNIIDKK